MRNIFSDAQKLIAQGRPKHAIQLIQSAKLPTAKHKLLGELILAAAAQQLQRLDTAEIHLKNALLIDPLNPDANLNYVRLLRQQKRFNIALSRLESLPPQMAKHPQCIYLAALTKFDLGQYTDAVNQLSPLISSGFSKADVYILLSKCYRYLEQYELALPAAKSAMQLSENSTNSLNEYGLVLKLMHKWDEAIQTFESALRKDSTNPILKKNLASCKALAQSIEDAESIYQEVVDANPLDLDAQHWLSALKWEQGKEDYLSNYELALSGHPAQPELTFEYAKKLSQVGEDHSACDLLETIKNIHKIPQACILYAQLRRESRDFDTPVSTLKQCLDLHPDSDNVKFEYAKALLSRGCIKEALSTFEFLVKHFPLHQGYICFRNTALKLLNDDRYHYYCNYDEHVLEAVIEKPNGYSSLEDFNQALKHELKRLHTNKRAPLDQSLRNGTQTWENLFKYDVPVINHLVVQLREQTQMFLSKLKSDEQHPFLSRLSSEFTESDSWSVILNKAGFHVSHFHPAGWLSAPYYVEVPKAVQSQGREGWLELGKPGIQLSTHVEAETLIAPKPGKLVQFPSYMWHGTRAFNTNEQRITVAYDTLPIKQ